MTAEEAGRVTTYSRMPASGQRRWRNFLLDPRFQLKYTSMVVVATVIVASALGSLAYRYSTGQTELMNIQRMEQKAADSEIDEAFIATLDHYAREADDKVRNGIILGILILTLTLGMIGVVVTHKLVGPAYRLRRLLRDVAKGSIKTGAPLRKGDELQDVFEAFTMMIESLREAHHSDIAKLEEALEKARAAGAPDLHAPDVVLQDDVFDLGDK